MELAVLQIVDVRPWRLRARAETIALQQGVGGTAAGPRGSTVDLHPPDLREGWPGMRACAAVAGRALVVGLGLR